MISSARTRRHLPSAPLRRLLLVSAVALIPVLAGCEAGNNAPTLSFHYPTDAAGTVAGDIAIRNVFVLGAPLGSSLHPGQTASLFFSLITNGGPDRLLSISARGSASSVQLPAGGIAVLPNHPVLFNGPQTQAYLAGITRTITGGSSLTLIMDFQKQGLVTLQVPVMARAAHYVTYGPPPSPSASPAATTAHRKHPKATGVPTPTPSVTPTATPGGSPTPSPTAS